MVVGDYMLEWFIPLITEQYEVFPNKIFNVLLRFVMYVRHIFKLLLFALFHNASRDVEKLAQMDIHLLGLVENCCLCKEHL